MLEQIFRRLDRMHMILVMGREWTAERDRLRARWQGWVESGELPTRRELTEHLDEQRMLNDALLDKMELFTRISIILAMLAGLVMLGTLLYLIIAA